MESGCKSLVRGKAVHTSDETILMKTQVKEHLALALFKGEGLGEGQYKINPPTSSHPVVLEVKHVLGPLQVVILQLRVQPGPGAAEVGDAGGHADTGTTPDDDTSLSSSMGGGRGIVVVRSTRGQKGQAHVHDDDVLGFASVDQRGYALKVRRGEQERPLGSIIGGIACCWFCGGRLLTALTPC